MRKVLSSVLMFAVLVSFSPAVSLAQTSTTTTNAQVEALLAQIRNLQAQIQALQTAQNNVSSTLSLIRNLKQGMSGDDVRALQAVLAADPTIYPEGSISGYYGRLTAEAVKKFQRKHGLESVGTVGPKTLRKLNEEFGRLGLSFENSFTTATSTGGVSGQNRGQGKQVCAKVAPGHLIAPGWLKKNNGERPIVPECQNLPRGIEKKGDDWWNRPTTTPVTPPPATTTPDTIAPSISVISVAPASTTATVSWTTNESSDSKVWLGTSTPVVLASSTPVTVSGMLTNHSVALSGLATSTTYYYVVGSTDASGNTATSSTNSFVTTSGL